MPQHLPPIHKTFISYHTNDQRYKDLFIRKMDGHIVDKSVGDDDIDITGKHLDHIRQIIRDDYISDATVTVVLIGAATWQRKHVDWEIAASLMDTNKNPRCGLIGIILPTHPDFNQQARNPHLMPQRLAANIAGTNPYAAVYQWTKHKHVMRDWIHTAFKRRKTTLPNNTLQLYTNNRSGNPLNGWQGRI